MLYLLTWVTTTLVGGFSYAAAVMTVLTLHELGHYLQARHNGIPASLPFFIPIPLPPFGTMGAVIAMRSHSAGSRALFDLAITGPLAGLVPALLFSAIGLQLSEVQPIETTEEGFVSLGTPLVFQWLTSLSFGSIPEGHTLVLHPIAFAGWVGIFITALNLLPIGQFDGGHIFYTLLPHRAYFVSLTLVSTGIVAIIADGFSGWEIGVWPWSLMIAIILLLGVRHPPTADIDAPLDWRRRLLGVATLLFVLIGFTPRPFP